MSQQPAGETAHAGTADRRTNAFIVALLFAAVALCLAAWWVLYVTPAGKAALEMLGAFGLPATFLIDRQGRELGRKMGPAEWDSPAMTEFLKQITKLQKETNP